MEQHSIFNPLKSLKFITFAVIMLGIVSCSASRTMKPEISSSSSRLTWSVSLLRNGSAMVTGLCIADTEDDRMTGTFVSEFGVRAFDFKAVRKPSGKTRVKILAPSKALSNPVLRHMLGKDLGKVFSEGELLDKGEGEYPYRYSSASGIEYVFSPSGVWTRTD